MFEKTMDFFIFSYWKTSNKEIQTELERKKKKNRNFFWQKKYFFNKAMNAPTPTATHNTSQTPWYNDFGKYLQISLHDEVPPSVWKIK